MQPNLENPVPHNPKTRVSDTNTDFMVVWLNYQTLCVIIFFIRHQPKGFTEAGIDVKYSGVSLLFQSLAMDS